MKVKLVNFRDPDMGDQISQSLNETGFVVLTHHGIDLNLIKDAQTVWRQFFLKDQGYKNFFINEDNDNMGYKGFKSETALGAQKADIKEFFHWKFGEEIPDEVQDITIKLFSQLEDLGMMVLHALDQKNEFMTKYLSNCLSSDNTILRSLYYPAADFSQEEGAVRAAAHEDINFITLLVAASAPGLQVLDKAGNWHDVPHETDSIVVNIGDMLQLASNGKYRSTTHRVVNPEDSSSDRISIPLFIHPHSNVLLADGVTAQQFLNERIAAIYGKK